MTQLILASANGRRHSYARPREPHAVNQRQDHRDDLMHQFAGALQKLRKAASIKKGGVA